MPFDKPAYTLAIFLILSSFVYSFPNDPDMMISPSCDHLGTLHFVIVAEDDDVIMMVTSEGDGALAKHNESFIFYLGN